MKYNNYMEGNKFRHDYLGREILKEYKVISINNILHIKIGDIYSANIHDFERIMRNKYNAISIRQQKDVYQYLKDFAEIKEDTNTSFYVEVKNGIIEHIICLHELKK